MGGIFSNDEQEVREQGATDAITPDTGGGGSPAVGSSDRNADMAASGAQPDAPAGGAGVTDSDAQTVGSDDLAADMEASGADPSGEA